MTTTYGTVEIPLTAAWPDGEPVTDGPAEVRLDLSGLLPDVEASDHSWLRLALTARTADGGEEIAVQFTPDDPGTGTSGTLTWIADARPATCAPVLQVTAEQVDHSATVAPLPRVMSTAFPRLQVIPGADRTVAIQADGDDVFGYCHDPAYPKPFFYPVLGPAGRPLTRQHHARDLDGRSHEHHRSMWVEHLDVNHWSFETEDLELLRAGGDGGEFSLGIGRIRHLQCTHQVDGAVFARLGIDLAWETADGQRLLDEHRDVRLFELSGRERLIDLGLTFRATTEATFLQSSFGGLAVRVAAPLEVGNGYGEVTNSEGGRNEGGTHRRRARWCDYSGPVSRKEWNGIAIFDHPANPNHPNGWHVRDDGWFCAAPFLAEEVTLLAGEQLALRYRVLLHAGDAGAARIDARYAQYASPARVSVGAPIPVAERQAPGG